MALPLLPLLGGLLRGGAALAGRAGSSMLGSFGLRSAATSIPFRGLGASMAKDLGGQSLFAQLAARQLAGLSNHQRFDMSALARRLGTPVPNQRQVDAEKKRIQQNNQDNSLSSSLMRSTVASTAKLGAFATSLTVATKGLSALSRVSHQHALESLRMFNPNIAAEAARQEKFNMQSAMQRGRDVSGSTRRLGEAVRRNSMEWQPYDAAAENLKNQFMTIIVAGATYAEGVLEKLGITEAVRKYNKSQEDKRDVAQNHLQNFLRDTLAGRNFKPLNNRPNDRPGSRM